MVSRLLITGGSGFIGRRAVHSALESGFQVLNLDLKEPDVSSDKYESVAADVRDCGQIAHIFEDFAPTHVLHLAAETDFSLSDVKDFSTIVDGSKAVFQVAAHQPSVHRLVHVSTQYVLEPGVQPNNERHYQPYAPYGEAKVESEKRLWASNLSGWTIVRPCVVWGPNFETFADGLLKYIDRRLYRHPASRRPIMRTFGYVDNVANQMVSFLSIPAEKLDRKVYYLGDEVMDYAIWADGFSRALTGHDARRVPKSALFALGMMGEGAKKLGIKLPYNMGRYHRMTTSSPLDLDATFKAVGSPSIDFETGVQRTVTWLREYWNGEDKADADVTTGQR